MDGPYIYYCIDHRVGYISLFFKQNNNVLYSRQKDQMFIMLEKLKKFKNAFKLAKNQFMYVPKIDPLHQSSTTLIRVVQLLLIPDLPIMLCVTNFSCSKYLAFNFYINQGRSLLIA